MEENRGPKQVHLRKKEDPPSPEGGKPQVSMMKKPTEKRESGIRVSTSRKSRTESLLEGKNGSLPREKNADAAKGTEQNAKTQEEEASVAAPPAAEPADPREPAIAAPQGDTKTGQEGHETDLAKEPNLLTDSEKIRQGDESTGKAQELEDWSSEAIPRTTTTNATESEKKTSNANSKEINGETWSRQSEGATGQEKREVSNTVKDNLDLDDNFITGGMEPAIAAELTGKVPDENIAGTKASEVEHSGSVEKNKSSRESMERKHSTEVEVSEDEGETSRTTSERKNSSGEEEDKAGEVEEEEDDEGHEVLEREEIAGQSATEGEDNAEKMALEGGNNAENAVSDEDRKHSGNMMSANPTNGEIQETEISEDEKNGDEKKGDEKKEDEKKEDGQNKDPEGSVSSKKNEQLPVKLERSVPSENFTTKKQLTNITKKKLVRSRIFILKEREERYDVTMPMPEKILAYNVGSKAGGRFSTLTSALEGSLRGNKKSGENAQPTLRTTVTGSTKKSPVKKSVRDMATNTENPQPEVMDYYRQYYNPQTVPWPPAGPGYYSSLGYNPSNPPPWADTNNPRNSSDPKK